MTATGAVLAAVTDWATVAAAGAAAIAAVASWASVWTVRRQWSAANAPHLRLVVAEDRKRGRLQVRVTNAGPGTARAPAFAISVGDRKTGGWTSPVRIVLLDGETAKLNTEIPIAGDDVLVRGVALCSDITGVVHVWDLDSERHETLRTRWLRRRQPMPLALEALEQMYPDVEFDRMRLVEAGAPDSEAETGAERD